MPSIAPAVRAGYRRALPDLRRTRERLGRPLRDVADACELSTATLSRIENGVTRASPCHQAALAAEIGSPVDKLFAPAETRALEERDAGLAAAYLDGASTKELSLRYNLDRSRVRKILGERGIAIRERTDPAVRAAAIARYFGPDEPSAELVAGESGVTRNTVRNWARQQGLAMRPASRPRKYPLAEPRRCVECGTVFRPDAYRVAQGRGRFCSARCAKGGGEGRAMARNHAAARIARARDELLEICSARGLLTVADAAAELHVAPNSITGRYIANGLLPAEKLNLHGTPFWLIAPADLSAFRRAWVEASGSLLEARMKWRDERFVLAYYRGTGKLDALAHARGLSTTEAESLVRGRVAARRGLLRRRGGAPRKLEVSARLVSIAAEALESGYEPETMNELLAYVALVDFQRNPDYWPDDWKLPEDESFVPSRRKNSLERVRVLAGADIKALLARSN